MRAEGIDGKPKSERTAGQSTSDPRDVAQETSSVEQETKKVRRAVASAPELSNGEESDSDPLLGELRQSSLERKKKKLVDNVMVIVMQWLDTTIPPKQHCRGDSSSVRSHGASAGGGRGAKRTGSDSNDDKENEAPERPRKRQQRDETPGGDGAGGGGRGGKGNKRAKKDPEEAEKKFACPFHKHDSKKYNKSRACRFPGFKTPARVKEHIYRVHLDRLVCPRCAMKFCTNQALQLHLRAINPCNIKDVGSLDGIDSEKEAKLRAKPKKDNSTAEEQWYSIYMIVFPDTPKDSMPRSPYCDDQQPQSLEGMHEYVRRELPRVVRSQLEEYLENILSGAGAEMKETILRLLPQLTRRLIEIYRGDTDQSESETPTSVTSDAGVANNAQLPELNNRLFLGLDQPHDDPFVLEDLVDHYGLSEDIFDSNYQGTFGLGSTSASTQSFQ